MVTNRQKNTKVLNPIETIELLRMLKDSHTPYIARHFGITERAVRYHKRKHNAYSDYLIQLAIQEIERKIRNPYNNIRDFKKQEECTHKNAKVFLKCTCSMCLSENEPSKIIDILKRNIRKVKQIKI